MKGRKRQVVVDTLGLPIRVAVQPANVQDRLGARTVLQRLPPMSRLVEVRADKGYRSEPLAVWCRQTLGARLNVTQRDPSARGFVVQQGRWVVERTFAWLGRYRRLSKDYEQSILMSEAYVYVASLHLLLRRLAR